MLAFPASSESHSAFLFPQPAPSIPIAHSLSSSQSISSPPKPCYLKFTPFLYCASNSNPTTLDHHDDDGNLLVPVDDDDDDDDDEYVVEGSDSLAEDGVFIEVMKLEKNTRRIESRISIEAPLDAIWNILTDYERLADFIPGLAVSQLLQKADSYARLFQIGQQNLAFGIKFNAQAVVDCYEKELQTLPSGMKREIEFKMVEGDFQVFEGKWSILQQFNGGSCEESQVQEVNTTLSYIVDIKPKLWLPVRLIEGRLCNEIKTNLASIRNEAIDRALLAHQFE